MRKPNLTLLCTAIAALVNISQAFAQFKGDTYSASKTSKSATFYCVFDNTSGFASEKNGAVSGLMVDIMKEFEKYLLERDGIEVKTEYVLRKDFSEFLSEVRKGSGGVFGLSNISINEERKEIYSFSPPCLDNILILLSHNDVPLLTKLEDMPLTFNEMVAYTLPNSSYSQRLNNLKDQYYPEMKIERVSTESEIIEKLMNEKSYAILDFNQYLDILKKKHKIKRHSVGDLKDDQFGIIMPKGSDWNPVIEAFFESGFAGSTRYSQIISDNLGSSALRLLNSVKSN